MSTPGIGRIVGYLRIHMRSAFQLEHDAKAQHLFKAHDELSIAMMCRRNGSDPYPELPSIFDQEDIGRELALLNQLSARCFPMTEEQQRRHNVLARIWQYRETYGKDKDGVRESQELGLGGLEEV